MEMLIVIILCLPLFCNGQASDQTLQPHARGEDVVDATIEKIRSKCILVDDKYLMRRIAAVETDFGKKSAPNTGGIWKITGTILMVVKNSCQFSTRQACNVIMQVYSFDATKATMSQMDIPLYSALIMQTYLSIHAAAGRKIPVSKSDQADFWMRYIRPKGNKNDFMATAATKIRCAAVQMELVIAIDASGSVGSSNFQKTLNFLQSLVKNMQVSPNMTRIAVMRFASTPTIGFYLQTYSSSRDVINGIARIKYTGGFTATDKAIDLARSRIFVNARSNVPKVFVLITDGRSNDMRKTIAAANLLKKDTTIFTIGIGNVNPYEMLAIASVPQCSHYYALLSYNEIDAITNEIQRESCVAPVAVKVNSLVAKDTVIEKNPIPSNNDVKIQNLAVEPDQTSKNGSKPQNRINIKVEVICGTVNIYAHNLQTPSPSVYAYSAVATDGNPGWIHSPTSKKLYLSLVSKKRLDLALSSCSSPHYNVSFNPPDEGVTVICRENGKERNCTSDDIKVSFGSLCGDDDVPNPCTKANILNNKMRFKHPKSPNKYIQCKPTGQMEIVKCPVGTQYDESQSVCGSQITGLPPKSYPYKGPNPCTKKAIMNGQFYFANPSDKSSFIQCNEWGVAFLVKCPKNTAWSQQAYTCVHHSKLTSPTNNPCKPSNKNPSLYHENPGNRRSFIQCDNNGNAYTMPCPLGTVWLQANLTCVHDSIKLGLTMSLHLSHSSTAPAPITTTAPTKCTYGEYLPHTDPHKYNVCEWNGRLTEMSCPAGLVWYQSSKVCNWPSGSA